MGGECVAKARAADDHEDKVLWLTLAQSWVLLAEHAARGEQFGCAATSDESAFAVHWPE